MFSHKREYDGLSKNRSCYTNLSHTWEYNCPYRNNDYFNFANGVNCLCRKNQDRTSGDIAVITGKKWPVVKNIPGWKY